MEIKILLDFCFGPIFKPVLNKNNELCTGNNLVDNDEIVKKLDQQISILYNDTVRLNKADTNYINNKFELLSLIDSLKSRLNEINDGTFIVKDYETKRIVRM